MRHFVFWLVLACSASASRAAIRDDAPIAGIDTATDSPRWFPHTSPALGATEPAPEVGETEPAPEAPSRRAVAELAQQTADALSLAWGLAIERVTGALIEVLRDGTLARCEPSELVANL